MGCTKRETYVNICASDENTTRRLREQGCEVLRQFLVKASSTHASNFLHIEGVRHRRGRL